MIFQIVQGGKKRIEGGIWVAEEMCESIMRRRPGRRIVSISRIISRNKHLTIYFIGRRISYGQMPIDRNIEQCANSHGWRPSASVYGGERKKKKRKKKMFAGFSLHSINHSVAAPSDPQSFSRSFAPLFRYIYIYIYYMRMHIYFFPSTEPRGINDEVHFHERRNIHMHFFEGRWRILWCTHTKTWSIE